MFSAACAAALVYKSHFFCLYQQNKSSESKVNFRQASNHCKSVLDAVKLTYATKTKESITSKEVGSGDFLWIANGLLCSMTQRCYLLHLIKQNCLLKSFLRTLILMTWVSLPAIPSRTNLKLHIISLTFKMVEKVITNHDSSKASGPDCIPVVVLKNCEPEFSYILAELFNMFWKESCFWDCLKVSLLFL